MAVNALARNASGLPVTLLAIHVIIHILCTLLIYAIWWNVQQSVIHPVVLPMRREGATAVAGDNAVGREFVAYSSSLP